MDIKTHPGISKSWVGEALELSPGQASARLLTTAEMGADDKGLVHGGFTFGLADYCAMLAVNDPNVVLGGAEVRFLAPVKIGEVLTARAHVKEEKGKKRTVHCSVSSDRAVFDGVFTCFVLEKHILDQQD